MNLSELSTLAAKIASPLRGRASAVCSKVGFDSEFVAAGDLQIVSVQHDAERGNVITQARCNVADSGELVRAQVVSIRELRTLFLPGQAMSGPRAFKTREITSPRSGTVYYRRTKHTIDIFVGSHAMSDGDEPTLVYSFPRRYHDAGSLRLPAVVAADDQLVAAGEAAPGDVVATTRSTIFGNEAYYRADGSPFLRDELDSHGVCLSGVVGETVAKLLPLVGEAIERQEFETFRLYSDIPAGTSRQLEEHVLYLCQSGLEVTLPVGGRVVSVSQPNERLLQVVIETAEGVIRSFLFPALFDCKVAAGDTVTQEQAIGLITCSYGKFSLLRDDLGADGATVLLDYVKTLYAEPHPEHGVYLPAGLHIPGYKKFSAKRELFVRADWEALRLTPNAVLYEVAMQPVRV